MWSSAPAPEASTLEVIKHTYTVCLGIVQVMGIVQVYMYFHPREKKHTKLAHHTSSMPSHKVGT